MLISQDSELAEIWWKGIDDFASLSEVERRQFDPLAHMYFFVDNQSYQFLQEGIISPLAWDNVDRELRWKLAQPGLR
jgi:hypothetical protein